MTNTELRVLQYVQTHAMTRRGTVVESLADGNWEVGRRVRAALDTLSVQRIIVKIGTGRRNLRYTIPSQ